MFILLTKISYHKAYDLCKVSKLNIKKQFCEFLLFSRVQRSANCGLRVICGTWIAVSEGVFISNAMQPIKVITCGQKECKLCRRNKILKLTLHILVLLRREKFKLRLRPANNYIFEIWPATTKNLPMPGLFYESKKKSLLFDKKK